MYRFVFLLVLFAKIGVAQSGSSLEEILTFEEYLGYVKQYHPLLKKANLQLSIGEANLLKARGGFDPKVEVDYQRKEFKKTEYFNQLNAAFKIPTWYGVEFKANFEQNSGKYLNPNLTVPEDGLYSAGISLALAQGLLINERMATLKKAKFFIEQSQAAKELLVNDLVFEASKAYFEWLETHNEFVIYTKFLSNAKMRFNAVKRNVEVGEKSAIDSIEAKITYQNRKLNLEVARLKTRKAALKASNFLWLKNVPLEIQEYVCPETPNQTVLESSLVLEGITQSSGFLENHPKLRALAAKIDGLEVDQSLKRNKLLPKLNLQYNLLSPDVDQFSNFTVANYKTFVNFSMPLFLRKERGALKLAKLKLQDANFERISTSLVIQNKIDATTAEVNSLKIQNNFISGVVTGYEKMLAGEERKFKLGESSLFLINSREQKLIEATLKRNALRIKSLKATASLYNALGLSDQN